MFSAAFLKQECSGGFQMFVHLFFFFVYFIDWNLFLLPPLLTVSMAFLWACFGQVLGDVC